MLSGEIEASGTTSRPLTFGEMAVGLTFNPGGHEKVNAIKKKQAEYIDLLNQYRSETESQEAKRQLSVAITEAQTSQMWAVKAVTWQY